MLIGVQITNTTQTQQQTKTLASPASTSGAARELPQQSPLPQGQATINTAKGRSISGQMGNIDQEKHMPNAHAHTNTTSGSSNTKPFMDSSNSGGGSASVEKQHKKRSRGFFKRKRKDTGGSTATYIIDPAMIDTSGRLSVHSDAGAQHNQQRRMEGGCIKLPTHILSLAKQYDGPAGHNKAVQWGEIEVRSHSIRLGDNPCCRGPPITTQWKAHETVSVTVDHYESTRPPYRGKNQLIIPVSAREDMLRNAGYSRGEMKEKAEEGALIRVYRNRNCKLTPKEQLSAFVARLSASKTHKSIPIDVAKQTEAGKSSNRTTRKMKQEAPTRRQ